MGLGICWADAVRAGTKSMAAKVRSVLGLGLLAGKMTHLRCGPLCRGAMQYVHRRMGDICDAGSEVDA
jgi:hypothetical protein